MFSHIAFVVPPLRRPRTLSPPTLSPPTPQIDLVFLVDATGSMGAHIEGVKTQIRNVVADLKKAEPQLEIRLAFVGRVHARLEEPGCERTVSHTHQTKHELQRGAVKWG
jgi:hypothetical protein